MTYVAWWLACAAVMCALIIFLDRTITRVDAVAACIMSLIAWPMLVLIVIWVALDDAVSWARSQDFTARWRDWWSQPLFKTRRE